MTCKTCPNECCPKNGSSDCALRVNVGTNFQHIKIQPSPLAPVVFSVALWVKLHSSNLAQFPIFTYASSQSPDALLVYMGLTGMFVSILHVRNTALGTYPSTWRWQAEAETRLRSLSVVVEIDSSMLLAGRLGS